MRIPFFTNNSRRSPQPNKKCIPSTPNAPFLYPLKTSENHKVFSYFHGVEKGCFGNEWINRKWKSETRGLGSFRKNWYLEEVSGESAIVSENVWRSNKTFHHESSWLVLGELNREQLTLIWVGFLGVSFEVSGGGKITPPLYKTC